MAIVTISSASVLAQTSLAGTKWKLVEANGNAVTNSSAAIEIDDDATKFTGSTGCNRMFGTVTIKGRKINFGNIGSTRMMCKLAAGNVAEPEFLKALGDAKAFRQSNRTLRLMNSGERTILRFNKVDGGEKAVRLEDKKWVLEQIKGQQTFAPLPYAFLNFDGQKHSAGGNSSCNVFGGSYTQTYGSIKFSKMISTMRACVEDNKMSVERDMLDGLRDANRFEIKDGRLYIYKECDILLTFRGETK